MGKHEKTCTRPLAKIPEEIKNYGESIRKVKTWDEFVRQVAPDGEIQYDMASNIDSMYPNSWAATTPEMRGSLLLRLSADLSSHYRIDAATCG